MLRSSSLMFRPIERSDLAFLQDLANDVRVTSSVVGWDFPVSLHGQESWLARSEGDVRTRRLVVANLDGTPIGMTGLWDIDWHNRSALTALKLHPDADRPPRSGSDAIMLMNAYAFYGVGLRRLWGEILDFNAASMGAYVKNGGWRIEGRLRQSVWRDGEFHDSYRVACLVSDFDALPDAELYRQFVTAGEMRPMTNIADDWWASGLSDTVDRSAHD
jgi:RimJ/RimL family protein N-acetyltransferase